MKRYSTALPYRRYTHSPSVILSHSHIPEDTVGSRTKYNTFDCKRSAERGAVAHSSHRCVNRHSGIVCYTCASDCVWPLAVLACLLLQLRLPLLLLPLLPVLLLLLLLPPLLLLLLPPFAEVLCSDSSSCAEQKGSMPILTHTHAHAHHRQTGTNSHGKMGTQAMPRSVWPSHLVSSTS